ncbi:MAG: peptidyl-tRNA hydrolase Pth2 [Candidatus Woesearchaeota archaeon]
MKQVIVVRADLKLPKGKMAAQVAHAAVAALERASPSDAKNWIDEGMAKIVLKVESLEELKSLQAKARAAKLPNALITDAGKTVVAPGTVTCLGIGPADENKIDAVTGSLKMM